MRKKASKICVLALLVVSIIQIASVGAQVTLDVDVRFKRLTKVDERIMEGDTFKYSIELINNKPPYVRDVSVTVILSENLIFHALGTNIVKYSIEVLIETETIYLPEILAVHEGWIYISVDINGPDIIYETHKGCQAGYVQPVSETTTSEMTTPETTTIETTTVTETKQSTEYKTATETVTESDQSPAFIPGFTGVISLAGLLLLALLVKKKKE